MAVNPVSGGFWLEYGNREAPQLVAFASELAQTPAGRPGVAFGPLNGPSTLDRLFEQARLAGDAILDPHGYLLDRDSHSSFAQPLPLAGAEAATSDSATVGAVDDGLARPSAVTGSPRLRA